MFKARRLLYHSTPGLRVIKKKKRRLRVWGAGFAIRFDPSLRRSSAGSVLLFPNHSTTDEGRVE